MTKADARMTRRSGNLFLDLGFPPHEAAVMLLRCELAEALRQWMAREGLTQVRAAKRLGVAQPRISEIACNKVDKLSLDYLVSLCAKVGVSVAGTSGGVIDGPNQPLPTVANSKPRRGSHRSAA